jgi:hypothetical protein
MKRIAVGMMIVLAGIAYGNHVFAAESTSSLTFPVKELGNCKDKDACKAFCDVRANQAACTAFGRLHGLIKPKPVQNIEPQIKPEIKKEIFRPVPLRLSTTTATSSGIIPRPIMKPSSTIDRASTSSPAQGGGAGNVTVPAPQVCADAAGCERLCRDSSGQFYNHPDCMRYRELREKLKALEQSGEVAPDPSLLPHDNACTDATTCAARCNNEDSPYFLKPECVEYREKNPPEGAMSGRSLFFANVLMSLRDLFR